MDLTKKQQQLMRKAQRAPKAKAKEATRDEQRFCGRCLAVSLFNGLCPNCDKRQATYQRFCRSCTHIHSSSATCSPWRPRES